MAAPAAGDRAGVGATPGVLSLTYHARFFVLTGREWFFMGKGTWRWLSGVVLAGLLSVGYATGGGGAGPMLVLDTGTREARLDETTLHASEVTGAHVGQIDEELFVAIVVDDATGSGEARTVRGYVCNREVGVWLDGEVNGNEVTLSSDDGVIQLDATIGTDDGFGVAHLGEAASHPFTVTSATGDAGLYRAEVQIDGEDRIAGWVVLEDGRQRGGLDGKGNDPL